MNLTRVDALNSEQWNSLFTEVRPTRFKQLSIQAGGRGLDAVYWTKTASLYYRLLQQLIHYRICLKQLLLLVGPGAIPLMVLMGPETNSSLVSRLRLRQPENT